jgi:hypothetical protein
VLGPTDLVSRSPTGTFELRSNPLRIEWPLDGIVSSDSRTFAGQFSCMVRALESPVEQKMLRDSLLGSRSSLAISDVAGHFAEAIKTAALKESTNHDAEALFADTGRGNVQAAILSAAHAIAFVCGIELLPPFALHLDCPALRNEIEQSDRLRIAGELFAKFQSMRSAAPDLPAGQILSNLSPGDQPAMLRTLLVNQGEAREIAKLWAASGDVLYEIPNDPSENPRTAKISRDPLRSVSPGSDGDLLLGSRSGVCRFRENSEQPAVMFADPSMSSQTGFNAAVISSGRLWATHAEAGLIGWNIEQPQPPTVRIKESAVPAKNIALLPSGIIVFTSGPKLLTVATDGVLHPIGPDSQADIVALFVCNPSLIIVFADGRICACDLKTFRIQQQRNHPRKIGAAAILPWMDDFRILLAEEVGGIACLGLHDEVTTQYSSPHVGCRMLAASRTRIAAVSADRQRLILWNSWEGRYPAAEIHLGAIAKHRIADIAFI